METLEKPDEPAVFIVADHRENEAKIGEILERDYRAKLERRQLDCGDYIINGRIAVERKTTADFAESIIDGRLFRQARKMKRSFDVSLFIIEGKSLDETDIEIHPHAVRGALVSLALAWRTPVLFSKDPEETALFIWLIGSQQIHSIHEWTERPGRRPKQFRKRQLYILQGLPGVGAKLAQSLLDRFGSVEKVICASSKDLREVPLIGKIKAERVRKTVASEGRGPGFGFE